MAKSPVTPYDRFMRNLHLNLLFLDLPEFSSAACDRILGGLPDRPGEEAGEKVIASVRRAVGSYRWWSDETNVKSLEWREKHDRQLEKAASLASKLSRELAAFGAPLRHRFAKNEQFPGGFEQVQLAADALQRQLHCVIAARPKVTANRVGDLAGLSFIKVLAAAWKVGTVVKIDRSENRDRFLRFVEIVVEEVELELEFPRHRMDAMLQRYLKEEGEQEKSP